MRPAGALLCTAVIALTAMTHVAGAATRYVDTVNQLLDTTVTVGTVARHSDMAVEVRGAMKGQGSSWGVSVGPVKVALETATSSRRSFESRRVLRLTVEEAGTVLKDTTLTTGFATEPGEENSLAVTVSREGLLTVEGGLGRLLQVAALDVAPLCPGDSIKVFSRGMLDVTMIAIETTADPRAALLTDWTADLIDSHFAGTRPRPEGIWDYLDAETDDRRARRGGRYSLAIVPSAQGQGWDLIYLGGATVNSGRWTTGMLKGRLRPTIFKDHYDVEWIDATFSPMTLDVSAQIEQDAVITFSFPRYKSSLRFSLRPIPRR